LRHLLYVSFSIHQSSP